ncbi:MAG: PaaI family thioesterase [Candidatus Acidiferrales bacterium]
MADYKLPKPLDPDFERRVRESFKRQGLMQYLGASLVAVAAGSCEIAVPFRSELSQQHGYFHAGVSGAIADSACGYAAYSLAPRDSSVLTVEFKLNLLAPALGEALIAKAKVVRAGRTLTVCMADLLVIQRGVEKFCATSLSTIMTVLDRPDSPAR